MAFDKEQQLTSNHDDFFSWRGAHYTNTFSNSNSFTNTNTYNSTSDSHSHNVYSSEPAYSYSSQTYHTWHGFIHPWNKRNPHHRSPLRRAPSSPTPSLENSPCRARSGEELGQGHQLGELGERTNQLSVSGDRLTSTQQPRFVSTDTQKDLGQVEGVADVNRKSKLPMNPTTSGTGYRTDSLSCKSRTTSGGLAMAAAMFCCWFPNEDDF